MSDNKRFSIVVPTLWNYSPFLDFLDRLIDLPIIGEVIIINNNTNNVPAHNVLSHPKMVVCSFEKNIIVNPSWNFGVWQSSYNNICIMNDDVIFDTKIFDIVAEKLQPNMMIVNAQEPVGSGTFVNGKIDIKKYEEGMSVFNFGTLMFVRKEDWLDIPSGLNLFYGDYWIWTTMMERFNNNYVIHNLFFYTPGSVSTNQLPDKMAIGRTETHLYMAAIAHFKKNYLGILADVAQ